MNQGVKKLAKSLKIPKNREREREIRQNTVSKQLVEHHSSARDNLSVAGQTISNSIFTIPQDFGLGEFFVS